MLSQKIPVSILTSQNRSDFQTKKNQRNVLSLIEISRDGEFLEKKIPSVGEVQIFYIKSAHNPLANRVFW